MALFGSKKNKKDVVEKKVSKDKKVTKTDTKAVAIASEVSTSLDLSKIIKNPRISEKGAVVAETANAYVFDIAVDATKKEVKKAIEKIYKVVPLKVTIAQVPDKSRRVRGSYRKTGVKSGGKKAFVYLKKGDKIEFI